MSTEHTEAGVVADLAVKASGASVVKDEITGRSILIYPDGFVSDELMPQDSHGNLTEAPERIVQAVQLQTVDSLVDYVKTFRQAGTVLMADIDTNAIAGLVDYHTPDDANFVQHKAALTLAYSVEWKAWTAISGKLMPQQDFARFLEENAADIVAPSGADLLEVARDMRAVRSADFRRAVRTAGDDESFEYTETTEARSKNGTVEVPSKFKLEIPVYFGQPVTELYAFLRWTLDDGKLALGVVLHRPEHVRQAVFQQIVLDVAERTERPALFGKLV